MAESNQTQIVFPEKEIKIQSPFLYLQAVGSTGADGSTYGAHLRWLLLRNLGETHLPKGDYAETTINFNRPGDYVTLFRSQYLKRFPTIVDFSVKPDVVNDALAFWIYTVTVTNTVVYIHFRDQAKYGAVRAAVNPSTLPLQFIEQYCPALIEAEVKDKLFFAAEFDVERDSATGMRAEALSVETNVPLSPVFVSCRKVFTDRNWCPPAGPAGEPKPVTTAAVMEAADVPGCCDGPNLLRNGGFENPPGALIFQTDYAEQGGAKVGAINVTSDASVIRPGWRCLPHTGKQFLAVDGSLKAGSAVLRFKLQVDPDTDYCFTGWLATLWLEEVSIPLQFRFTSDNGAVQSFTQSTPATPLKWEEFSFSWNSGASRIVAVEIISLSLQSAGHDFGDFGIDDLWFCKGKRKPVEIPACCDGPNLLLNGGFEPHPARPDFMFESDYEVGVGRKVGSVNVTTDASKIVPQWEGLPHTGKSFLAVDGSTKARSAVLRFKFDVNPETNYCFAGWLATIFRNDVSIPLEFRFTSADGTGKSFHQSTPATVRTWEQFSFTWNSGASRTVTVEIISLSTQSFGNDFGIDDLWFCKGKQEPVEVPACCDGPNLLLDGGFEIHPALPEFTFETDYEVAVGARYGAINVTTDASSVNHQWEGLPHTGKSFLTVDGSEKPDQAALRFKRDVEPHTSFCFTGWLATLWKNDVSIPLEFRFTSPDGTVKSFHQSTPATVLTWEQFSFTWNSGPSRTVTVEIISLALKSIGNDFGIDDLWFCKRKAGCRARIVSENVRSVRFDVTGGYPRRIEIETYHDYIAGALWDTLENLALTKDAATAFQRLEPAPNSVNGHWQKFNDGALLKVVNYQDRWNQPGGLGQAVQEYISGSDHDPMAIVPLEGDVPEDGSIQISLLDALRMVSLDFHVARILGLGYLDRNVENDTDEFIYLGVYDTEGPLDDTNVARPVRHYFMSVPTRPVDYRLPDAPVLQPVTYGLAVDNGEAEPTLLTDLQGYTPDGLSRYIDIHAEPDIDSGSLGPFFVPPLEFCSIDKTASVFYGIEYRKQGEATWRKPEIAHDAAYLDLDGPPQFETLPLPNNADSSRPIFRHEERENGIHEYGGYGINWFSRVSEVGNAVATDATLIKKAQRLLPPANLAVQLIQHELPLMLTTQIEQNMLAALTGPDATLVRVTFDYFHVHDINYDFADSVELFFRSELPRNVVGAIKSVADDPSDSHKAIIRTMDYAVNSQGTTISPALAPSLFGNFIGGMLSGQNENYVVTNISASTQSDEGPIFTVQKNVRGNASDPGSTGTFVSVQKYVAPDLTLSNAQVMFMAVENMADPNSWGTPNPLAKVIAIGDASWTAHQETYVRDGETLTAKLRGVWGMATVTHTPKPEAAGVYKIVFDSYQFAHHSQHADADPVEWYKGAIRIPRTADPNGPKKVLEVLRLEHIGDGQPLELDVLDNAYDPNDLNTLISTGGQVEVNYYPGYRVYLHADPSRNFTQGAILPAAGEGNRKTWLAGRSRDTTQQYYSPVGIPAPIVALEFIKPFPPEQPHGGEFATWPDYYYKSSYTFTMDFAANHKPFAVVMYRANDEAILRALYTNETYDAVRQQLEILGDDDPYRSDRWRNLVSLDYAYSNPQHPFHDPTGSIPDGTFRKFPSADGYAFPIPDKGGLLNGVTAPRDVLDDLRDAICGAFTPLTELPLIYDLIKGPSYLPVHKPQNIRNDQGTLLDPNDPAFDIAPMAKRTGNGNEIQFTDFTLDGTGNNIFFYLGREIGNRGRMGDPSPIAGPIQLINTRPPDVPAVKKMYVEELNLLEGTGPAVNLEINAYPEVQKVGRVNIYRSTDPAEPLSVRTMQLVKTIDLAATNQTGNLSLILSDDFEDGFVPYGDMLFYRIVALRKVSNPNGGFDWAPSQPSKLLLTTVPDTINPEAPQITFTSNGLSGSPAVLSGVVMSWAPTVHNGTYHLDKMSPAGSWTRIYRVKTNDIITVDLAATDLGTNILAKETEDGDASVYHRFRVMAENSSGLFSLTDKVLVI
jgi:hypothetical protein